MSIVKRNISQPSVFVVFLSTAMFVASISGCSEKGNSTTADKDELASYLEEHPELVADAKKLEATWEEGYVEPEGESDQE